VVLAVTAPLAARLPHRLRWALLAAGVAALVALPAAALAQVDVRVRDLTSPEGAVPVRLMGYGLVVGLDGTGDRAIGGQTAGQTVQGVVNMLRRFNVEVPPALLRMRNVAAVLVTAEVSPFLRPGGRFEIQVASIGDARSLRGGVLFMTPLQADPGAPPVATAQGPLLVSEGGSATRYAPTIETSARIPSGGILEAELPRPAVAAGTRLFLREPDLGTATRIADAINRAFGENSATVEDEGAIALTLADSIPRPVAMARIRDLAITRQVAPRLVIDGKDGTVVAGGDMVVGSAVVSHGAVTLAIGADPDGEGAPATSVRLPAGISVQRVASALHAVRTPPQEIAAMFTALREVGALTAEVIVR
jgi:flagellar P-ring protein precursor FlgI